MNIISCSSIKFDDTEKIESSLSHQEWIKSLKTGDIINVCDEAGKWYESLVRMVDDGNVYVHFIGWKIKWNRIYDCKLEQDLSLVEPRYCHAKGPHVPTFLYEAKMNAIFLSWRIP